MTDRGGLSVEGIRFAFDEGAEVLAGVSVEVGRGEVLSLVGPSGCGKTTLLRVVAGLEVPAEGRVVVGGRTLTGAGRLVVPERRRVGMVFQDWALFPHLSVADNVGFGLPRAQRRDPERVSRTLALVGLEGLGDRMPDTLSGGQRQRVALGRALAQEPEVLLLDEPFSNLDASLRARVRTDVHRLLVEIGVTTVMVTHDRDEAFVLGDRVALMRDGQVVQSGPAADLYGRPVDEWAAGFLGEAIVLDAVVVDGGVVGAGAPDAGATDAGAPDAGVVEDGGPHPAVPGSADMAGGRGRTAPAGRRAVTALGEVGLLGRHEGRVRVLLRPEQVRLGEVGPSAAPAAGPATGPVEGRVVLVEYHGPRTAYVVEAGGTTLRSEVPGPPRWEVGATVAVHPPSEDVPVLGPSS